MTVPVGPIKHQVRADSLRYRVFARSRICAHCGIEGVYFALEQDHSQPGACHFNFYALRQDGVEVMMTKDHIVPQSKGGPDDLNNLQTLCYRCNQKKAAFADKLRQTT